MNEPMIGRIISHYRIIGKLGEGGMGAVYRAEDISYLSREVALKFLRPDATGAGSARQRLIREARAAAAIEHKNICTIYEVAEADGEIFIAMTLVKGESLDQKIAGCSLPLEDVLAYSCQIAEGLAAAHRTGLIHRDIKPGNIMVTPEGEVKILDFGLAKSPGCTQLTRTGATVGTVAYMSPEQTRGLALDGRTDIWSFGVVLYEMLACQRPFAGGHEQAVIHSILCDEPQPIAELCPDVPEDLTRIVGGTLIKNVDDRYQSIEDVLADLRSVGRVGTSQTVHLRAPEAVPATAGVEPVPWWRKRIVVASLAVATIAAGIAAKQVIDHLPPPDQPQLQDRVFVAAFDNRTGDPSLDEVGVSAAKRISEGLESEKLVDVTPPDGAPGSPGSGPPSGLSSLERAREVGASILVDGSYSVESDSLRMEARLLDVADGTIFAVVPATEGPLSESQAIIAHTRSRVVGGIASREDQRMLHFVPWEAPTLEAYREFQDGFGNEDRNVSIAHFKQAALMDPHFVDPSCWQILVLSVAMGKRAAADSLAEAILARRGYLGPHERLFVESLKAMNQGNHEEALRVLRELVGAEPEKVHDFQLWYVRSALRTNRPREASEYCERLMRDRSPAQGWVYENAAKSYHRLGEHERELEIVERFKEAYPDYLYCRILEVIALAALGRAEDGDRAIEESASIPVGEDARMSSGWHFRSFDYHIRMRQIEELRSHGYGDAGDARAERLVEWQEGRLEYETARLHDDLWPRYRLAVACYFARRWNDALALFEQLEPPDETYVPQLMYFLGACAARTGDRERALELKRQLLELEIPFEPGLGEYFAGGIAAALGERDEAMELLNLAIGDGVDIWWYLHTDMDYEPYWHYPPFQRLLKPRG